MIAYAQMAPGVAMVDAGMVTPFLFAGASGALAVAAALAAATFRRRAAAARAALARLDAQIAADLSVERVFLLRHDRLTPASPATDAYVRGIAQAASRRSRKLVMRAILGDDSTRMLAPLIRDLLNEGEPFTASGRDALGEPWRFIGETIGARAVLRLWPVDRIEAAPAAAPADAAAPITDADRAGAAMWRSALEQAPGGVVIFSPEGRLQAANAVAARLWRLDAEFIAGAPSLRALLDHLRGQGRAPERGDYADWRAALIEEPVAAIGRERLWSLPNGDALRVTAAKAADGGFTLYVSDETDAMGLGRRYRTAIGARRAMISALDAGLAVVGADGRLQLANPAFAELWGLDAGISDERLAGQTPLAAVAGIAARDEADRDIWRRIRDAAATSPGARRRAEHFTVSRLDGRRLSIRVTPLPDGATLIACADVTATHQAETALREKNEVLEATDRLKTEFLNDIAHQLRTPLNTVIGFADMLHKGMAGPLEERQAEYVADVLSAANDLRVLISDALDLGALRSGALTLERESVDLNRVALALASIIGPRAKRQGATLETALSRSTVRVTGDEKRLRHALFSAANAVASAAVDGDRLRLSLGIEATGGARLALTLERRGAREIEIEGLEDSDGVALALARRIAEMHGGSVTLEREAPQAAMRTAQAVFRLPLEAGSEQASIGASSSASSSMSSGASSGASSGGSARAPSGAPSGGVRPGEGLDRPGERLDRAATGGTRRRRSRS